MKSYQITIFMLFFLLVSGSILGQQETVLTNNYIFSGERTPDQQYFIQHTKMINYSLNGTRTGTDELKMFLTCLPKSDNSENIRRYTCEKFLIKYSGGKWVSIPALERWSYSFDELSTGIDDKGQVFGIDHARFENLKDNMDQPISQNLSYLVYNSFIDFHGFCDVFAEPVSYGNGIQSLTKIGQEIVHAAANSEPPVNLGSNIDEGSYFRNGEVKLAFIGLSRVNNSDCAMIDYDSGESSYKMLMTLPPDMKIESVGSSHYKGIIYKNLKTNWVEKVTMNEFVLSETKLPMPPNKINSATERVLSTDNVSKELFYKSLQI